MRVKELKSLIDTLVDQCPDDDVYVSFIMKNEQKPLDFLNKIKELSCGAFLRTTSFGTEVCVTDNLIVEEQQ